MLGAEDERGRERPRAGLIRLGAGVIAVVAAVGPAGVPETFQFIERVPGERGTSLHEAESNRQGLSGIRGADDDAARC